jgi:hypothetical protein
MYANARTRAAHRARMAVMRAECPARRVERKTTMLYTIAVVLVILWLLGMVTSVTMGGLVHVLLVIAIIVILLRVIGGRSAL